MYRQIRSTCQEIAKCPSEEEIAPGEPQISVGESEWLSWQTDRVEILRILYPWGLPVLVEFRLELVELESDVVMKVTEAPSGSHYRRKRL